MINFMIIGIGIQRNLSNIYQKAWMHTNLIVPLPHQLITIISDKK